MIEEKMEKMGKLYEKQILSLTESPTALSRYLHRRNDEMADWGRERLRIKEESIRDLTRTANKLGLSVTFIVTALEIKAP